MKPKPTTSITTASTCIAVAALACGTTSNGTTTASGRIGGTTSYGGASTATAGPACSTRVGVWAAKMRPISSRFVVPVVP